MKPVVIGLGYKARNGKDSVAKAIIAERGFPKDMPPFHGMSELGQMSIDGHNVYDVRRYAFGDALKMEVTAAIEKAESVVELFYQMDSQLPDWVQIEEDPDMTDPLCPYGKYRTLLQWWGTEYRRAQDTNYWVKRMAELINAEQPQYALITDVRFKNEFDYVSAPAGGYLARVSRIGFREVNNHSSEFELDCVPEDVWDYVLNIPEGDLQSLKTLAVGMFDDVVHKQLQRAA